jgi:hypothetical protein
MKICPKCNAEHENPGTFCSRKCANSRVWTAEAKQKKSVALKKFIEDNPAWKENQLKTFDQRIETQKKTLFEKNMLRFNAGLIIERGALKRWLITTRVEKCEVCEILPEWNGMFLSLQVDHIDGNGDNNLPDNLRLICPNCHSQTDTFSGKKHRI